MADEQMPKLNLAKDEKLMTRTIKDYMKILEKENLERVQKLKRIRKNNLTTAFILGAGIFGIYGYSIWAVKQETFLDDFDKPAVMEPAIPALQ